MRHQTLADEGFERYRKPTRRDQFLEEMEQIIPWQCYPQQRERFPPSCRVAPRMSQIFFELELVAGTRHRS